MIRMGSARSVRSEFARRFGVLLPLALCLLAASLVPAQTATAQPVFAAPYLPVDVGASCGSLGVADLNGDGFPDFVSACAFDYPGLVLVLLGNGDGTFRARTDYTVRRNSAAITLGDVNGDGRPDIVAVDGNSPNAADNTVSVLPGNGDGSFGAPDTFPTGIGPRMVAIADVNGDGSPDLLVANTGESPDFAGSVSVLIGAGAGKFVKGADYPTGSRSVALAVGDFNADGRPDLVVANAGAFDEPDSTVSVLLGSGDGTFGGKTDFLAGSAPGSVMVADLDGDGRPDIVVANHNSVSMLPGHGDGTFGGSSEVLYTGGEPLGLTIRDVNGDARPDLILAVYGGGVYGGGRHAMATALGNGDGTFGPRRGFGPLIMSGPAAGVLADLNHDGRPDYVVGSGSGLWMFPGNGDGTFGSSLEFDVGAPTQWVGIADMNGDGRKDIVATTWDGVSVLLGNGDGTLGGYRVFPTKSRAPHGLSIADLNRDGRPDVVVYDTSSYPQVDSTLSVLLGIGDGTLADRTEVVTGPGPAPFAIGDVNRDGKPDMVVVSRASADDSSIVSVLPSKGDGTFGPRTRILAGWMLGEVVIADIDRDGALDLVVGSCSDDDPAVTVLLGNGNGTFRPGPDVQMSAAPTSVRVADADGDGKPDLVAMRGYTSVAVCLGNGNGTFGPEKITALPQGTGVVEVADLDGDGKPDLVTVNGSFSMASVLPGNGDGTFGAWTSYGAGPFTLGLALGDMNGDGKTDFVTANWLSPGSVTVLLNRSPDSTTPTLVELFRATQDADGVRVEWTLGDPGAFRSIELQRGASASGAWSRVAGAPRVQGRVTSVLDDALAPGESRWYRLDAVGRDGQAITLGSIAVEAQGAIPAFALSPLSPNPTTGSSLVSFAVPSRTRVRLALLDVQGRELAALADGVREPGRYAAALDASDLRAGMYFVRLQAGGANAVRRLVVVR
jgi:hypothetical protein